MKKLMILAAVAFAAICSQAAVVKWGTDSAVKFGGTALAGQTVSLYIVGTQGADDMLFDTRTTSSSALGKGTLTSTTGDMQANVTYNDTVAGGPLWVATSGDVGRSYYIVIDYTDTASGKAYRYTSSAVSSSGLSDKALGSVQFAFNDSIAPAAGAKDAWVAVPEPTSGLLLLLGMAGLALKRKRA